ncbi:sunset domain-containing protein [Saccharothrix coeruleofusca]|uniref:sunset domain-containing protein n=1 Tax=Saccharothrix coeruleofusca TaxID=33919 RepID=UPI00167137D7|nr:hypothetical protein [Saccharothrix coeruleofusca]
MSLFGQVWLWSLLSFLAGVLLTWLVLVRPAKRELQDLEQRLLLSPRPEAERAQAERTQVEVAAPATVAPADDFDDWTTSPRAEVLTRPARQAPPLYDVSGMRLDDRDSLLEELDDEHRPLSDFEEEHDFPEFEPEEPRSRFELLNPTERARTQDAVRGNVTPEAAGEEKAAPEKAAPEKAAVPEKTGPEKTNLLPPVAEVARVPEAPTAPPEVPPFQPREVWRGEPVAEEEPVEREAPRPAPPSASEETTLIPATALAEAIAEVDRHPRDEQAWPDHDLTGEYPAVRDEDHAPTEITPAVRDEDHAPTQITPPVEVPAPPARSDRARADDAAFEQFLAEQRRSGEVERPAAAPRHEVEPEESEAERTEVAGLAPVVPPASEQDTAVQPALPADTAPLHGEVEAEAEPRHAEPEPVESEPETAEPEPAGPEQVVPAQAAPEQGTSEQSPMASNLADFWREAAKDVEGAEPKPIRSWQAKPEPVQAAPVQAAPVPPAPAERPEVVEAAPAEPTPEPDPVAETRPQPKVEAAPVQAAPVQAAAAEPEPAPKPRPEPRPEVKPKPKPEKKADKKPEPARSRSLFEPLVNPEDEAEAEQLSSVTKPTPPPTNDQPFVPKLAPELLASSGNGLPQRPTRQPGSKRVPPTPTAPPTASPAAPPTAPSSPAPSAKPATPPLPRPVRPRPVGFSPSTGGRPVPSTTRFQQPEGFNPRSPFGPGSVLPKSDGKAPAPEFQIKATLTGRRYFTAESANFRETRADVWFRTTADAEKAGFRPAP